MYLEYTSLSRAFAVDICKLPQHSMYMTQNTRGCHSPWLINLKKGSYKIGVIQIVYNCFRHSSGNWNKVRIKHKWIRDAIQLHRIILPLATCPTLVTTLRRPERSTHKKIVWKTAMKGNYLHLGQGKWQPGQESSRQSHKSRPECSKTPCSTLSFISIIHARRFTITCNITFNSIITLLS